jgi:cardiolipin synthase
MTGQLTADTTREVVNHPCQTTWNNLREIGEHAVAIVQGIAGKRLAIGLCGPPDPLPPCEAVTPAWPCPCPLAGPDLKPAQVALYPDGHDSLDSLRLLIDQATCRIDVLMFYWENDALGADVAARLAARAGPHLRVRVLVDGGGNLAFAKPENVPDGRINRVVAELARQPYVELIRIRNPFASFDHRKLVIVDSKVAWTGGRNFANSAFFKHHDLSFVINGPLVADLQKDFDTYWSQQGGPEAATHAEARTSDLALAESNALGRIVRTAPGRHELTRTLYRAVDQARHHVYVENVYFSDGPLVTKLARARRRGIDVRAVLTFSSSSSAINRANRVVANRLLKAGVRVYVYPIMTHMKAAAVDGCWAYIGTGNFDPLSLRHNREMGLSVGAGPLIGEIEERLFHTDFRPEWELTEPLHLNWGDYACELLASLAL